MPPIKTRQQGNGENWNIRGNGKISVRLSINYNFTTLFSLILLFYPSTFLVLVYKSLFVAPILLLEAFNSYKFPALRRLFMSPILYENYLKCEEVIDMDEIEFAIEKCPACRLVFIS